MDTRYPDRVSNLLCVVWVIFVVVALLNPVCSANTTWGNLSVGKFYTYSVQPSSTYPDRWSNEFTDGVKLTDELLGESWPLDKWVGWYNASVEIIVDLGKVYPVSHMHLHARSQTTLGIAYPSSVVLHASTDATSWTLYGSPLTFPADTSDYSVASVTANGGWVNTRYVKYSVSTSGSWVFLDELRVEGTIEDSSKYVPSYGCYHGAYPTDTGGHGYLDIANFETLAQKSIVMVLWYADWTTPFQNSIGYVIDTHLNGRYLEVGFLPYNATSGEIASGNYDTFLKNWFTDLRNKNYPVWIRPMNEMNGSWTFSTSSGYLKYGGDSQTYRWAWRRMYNIAEQVGATGEKQIFVWSPNAKSYPNEPWNNMTNYYPGHQYVDWVGLSVYSSQDSDTPTALISEGYGNYSSNKPMMIAEGAAIETTSFNKPQWITEWFSSLTNTYPGMKACVWFNYASATKNYRIDSSSESLSAYTAGAADSYFLGLESSVNEWPIYN